jgi:hypothetical protein
MKKIKIFFRKIRSALLYLATFVNRIYQICAMRALYKKGCKLNEANGITLFWVPGGMPGMLQLEAPLAAALKLRGYRVHAVICDGVFSACVKREITDQVPMSEWKKLCGACKRECGKVLESMDMPYSYIGDYVTAEDLSSLRRESKMVSWENVEEVQYGDVNIGKNVRSAILRFLKGYDLPNDQSLVHEYAFSGLVCAAAAGHVIEKIKPARIFMSHGVYVDWGPALHTALARKVPVFAWMSSYLPACFYFRHVEDGEHIDFHNMSSTAWNEICSSDFTGERSERLEQYLQDRYKKDTSFDMKYFKQYTGRGDELRVKYGLDASRPLWGIMAHINWDAVSDYSPMVYESFNQWMNDTIQVIKDITDVQWIIKVHPAEAWDNPESGVEYLIKKHFPDLPKHIRVLPAEENISPLDFFNMVDGGVTVFGTAGLEMALHGKPVILAGDGHYGRKGFTYDADSREQYRELLKQAGHLPPLSEVQRELVRKYAYCYFIQRQIPISVVKDPQSKWWSFQFDKKELLLEGRDPVIDFVCEKILDGTDFIMDDQLLRLTNENMDGQARC